MKASVSAVGEELGDRLGEVLADRFLYHFVVRRYALHLLGDDDEWGGLVVRPSGGEQRGDSPERGH